MGRARLALLAALSTAACVTREPDEDHARVTLPAPRPAALLPSPGPAPRRVPLDAVAANLACVRCHVEIAAEWRGSLHQRAYVDEAFQSQLAREPSAFCVGCHAPESLPDRPVPPGIGALGVACTSCHVVDGPVYAGAREPGPSAPTADAHAVARPAGFGGAQGCGGCHEFAFPDDRRARPLLMQSTIEEHAGSAHAEESCAHCHMPRVPSAGGGTHASHRFVASRDEATLRRALDANARLDGGTLVLELRPAEVGHAVPTGDLLRRLVVEVELLDGSGELLHRHRRLLARHFGLVRAPNAVPERALVRDDRVGVGGRPTELRFELGVHGAARRLAWRVRHERVGQAASPHDEEVVLGAIVVAEGELALTGALAR